MKRSYSYQHKSQKYRSSSVKNNKSSIVNNHNHFDEFRNDYDIFLDVELNKNYFSLRSFAMGGMPYFETSRISYETNSSSNNMDGKNLPQVIQDIIAGKLSPMIKDLFKGINIQGKGIPSFITDSRKSITARYMITLIDPDMIGNNNVSSFSHYSGFSKKKSIDYYYSSSLSESEYCNDIDTDKQKSGDMIDFHILHARKLSDISNSLNDVDMST